MALPLCFTVALVEGQRRRPTSRISSQADEAMAMVEGENSKWLLPVLGSSICWAISDVLCDVVIDEHDSDSESDDEEEGESSSAPSGKQTQHLKSLEKEVHSFSTVSSVDMLSGDSKDGEMKSKKDSVSFEEREHSPSSHLSTRKRQQVSSVPERPCCPDPTFVS